jgi:putative flippase GtrA
MIHQHVKLVKHKQVREIIIYGLVGLSSLIIQDIIYWTFHRYFGIFPSVAMIIGTVGGMLNAYIGHVKFTFQKHRFSRREFTKFMLTSGVGLCCNVVAVRILTKVFLLSPEWGLLPTLITPIITFLISKFWAFK